MATALRGANCPRCDKRTSITHCKSSRCKWFICGKCSRVGICVVFDLHGRSYLKEKGE